MTNVSFWSQDTEIKVLIAKMTELRMETCEALNNCRLVTESLVLLSYCQTRWALSRWYRQGFDTPFWKARSEKVCRALAFGKDSYQQLWYFSAYNTCTILESWKHALEAFVGDHFVWPSIWSRVIANTSSAVPLVSQVLKVSKDRGASLGSCSGAASPS